MADNKNDSNKDDKQEDKKGFKNMIKDGEFWLKVLKFIIELILEKGKSKGQALTAAAAHFGIAESLIKKKVGSKIP